ARQIGLTLALLFRILLLFGLTALMRLTYPVVTVLGNAFSWHDLILIVGGLFLIGKATHEIHREMEVADESDGIPASAAFQCVILQVIAIDIVFSLDSIITAIGMAQDIEIMIAAVMIESSENTMSM